MPLKFEQDKSKEYAQILEDYNNYEKFAVGKLDQNDNIEKKYDFTWNKQKAIYS